jgi:hypothetical protein
VRLALALLVAAACVPDVEPTRATDLRVPVILRDHRVALIGTSPVPDSAVASPEALRHYLEQRYWWPGPQAKIVLRQNLSDGFAATFELAHRREVHVVRQVGAHWQRCSAEVVDSAMTAEVIAYCRGR